MNNLWQYLKPFCIGTFLLIALQSCGASNATKKNTEYERRQDGRYSACYMGVSGMACFDIAKQFMLDKDKPEKVKEMLHFFNKSCDQGFLEGCVELAFIYQLGEVVDKDLSRAIDLFSEACYKGNPKACTLLGHKYADGIGVEKNISKASDFYYRACLRRHSNACGFLSALSDYADSDFSLAKKDCDFGDLKACKDVADMYNYGRGVGRDREKALKLYEATCKQDHMPACKTFAYIVNGQQLQQHKKLKRKYFTQHRLECANNLHASCVYLGGLYEAGRVFAEDYEQSLAFYGKSCKANYAQACTRFARMYQKGLGVTMDHQKAVTYFKKACEYGDMKGCSSLAFSYEVGRGIEKNLVKAKSIYRQACHGGELSGCNSWENMIPSA